MMLAFARIDVVFVVDVNVIHKFDGAPRGADGHPARPIERSDLRGVVVALILVVVVIINIITVVHTIPFGVIDHHGVWFGLEELNIECYYDSQIKFARTSWRETLFKLNSPARHPRSETG